MINVIYKKKFIEWRIVNSLKIILNNGYYVNKLKHDDIKHAG